MNPSVDEIAFYLPNRRGKIARAPSLPRRVDAGVDRGAARRKLPHGRRVIDRPADLVARAYLDAARRLTGLGDRRLARREREASLGILDPHPTVDDADFGEPARGIHKDEKFGPLDASGYVRRLDIKGPVARAKQLDDPAGQVEQGPARLPRLQNPQCRALIETDHLTGIFEAKGSPAPRTNEDSLSGAKPRICPGRNGLDRPRRPDERDLAFCGNDAAGRDLTSNLRRRTKRPDTKPYQQPKCCGLHRARLRAALCRPPTNQPAHPAFRGTRPPAAAASLCSNLGQICHATLGRILVINKRLKLSAPRRSVLRITGYVTAV